MRVDNQMMTPRILYIIIVHYAAEFFFTTPGSYFVIIINLMTKTMVSSAVNIQYRNIQNLVLNSLTLEVCDLLIKNMLRTY